MPHRQPAPIAHPLAWLALAMLGLTVYGALLPFHFTPRPWAEAAAAFRRVSYLNFSDLEGRGDWILTAVQFAALAFLSTAALSVRRRGQRSWALAGLVVVFCSALSVAIEFAQIYFPPRTVSLNDIVLASLGAITGVAAWLIIGPQTTAWARRLLGLGGVAELAAALLPVYLIVLLTVELMPFDVVTLRSEFAAKWTEGKVRLVPFEGLTGVGPLAKLALNAAIFFPIGLLPVLAKGRRARLAMGLTVPALIELGQLFVYSRVCDATDIITGMAGAWAGWLIGLAYPPARLAALAAGGQPWFRAAAPLLGICWAAMVLFLFWWPFDFTTEPARFAFDDENLVRCGWRGIGLVPFTDYYAGSKYQALDQFARKTLAFVPLGVVVALGLNDLFRRRVAARVVVVAAAIAGVVAIGRYFLPSHVPSVTDILLACGGTWAGFLLTRQVRAALWAETMLSGWGANPASPSIPSQPSFPFFIIAPGTEATSRDL